VQNALPVGSTWDGKSNLPMDEQSFQQLVTDSETETPANSPTSKSPPRT